MTVAAPPGRSRCSTRCRDRNGCKSALERDSAGTRTTGRADRGRPRHRSYHPPPAWRPAVDALPLRCDNAPAFVPLHGVGHGADANCQVRVGAVPAFQCWRRFIAPTDALSAAGVRKHAISRGIGRNRCHRRPRTRHHAGHRNCRRPRSFSKPHHRIAQVGPQGASRPLRFAARHGGAPLRGRGPPHGLRWTILDLGQAVGVGRHAAGKVRILTAVHTPARWTTPQEIAKENGDGNLTQKPASHFPRLLLHHPVPLDRQPP